MGLSRNKVAVSEGAAGSPPFYGESNLAEKNCRAEIERETKKRRDRLSRRQDRKVRVSTSIVVRFSETVAKSERRQENNP